jgi:hypothetical protein
MCFLEWCKCPLLTHFLSVFLLVPFNILSRVWVPLALLLSFYDTYLSCPMYSSVCECLLFCDFLSMSSLVPLICSPGCECPPLLLSFYVLTCPFQCTLQDVSIPCSLTYFLYYLYVIDSLVCKYPSLTYFLSISSLLFLICLLGCKCFSLTHFLFMFSLVTSDPLFRKWVPLAYSFCFVLTFYSQCAL